MLLMLMNSIRPEGNNVFLQEKSVGFFFLTFAKRIMKDKGRFMA